MCSSLPLAYDFTGSSSERKYRQQVNRLGEQFAQVFNPDQIEAMKR